MNSRILSLNNMVVIKPPVRITNMIIRAIIIPLLDYFSGIWAGIALNVG